MDLSPTDSTSEAWGVEPLRVLFGYDGSIGADAALAAVTTLPWSAGTHLRVIGVRDAHLRFLRPLADEILFAEFEEVVSRAARCLRAEWNSGHFRRGGGDPHRPESYVTRGPNCRDGSYGRMALLRRQ